MNAGLGQGGQGGRQEARIASPWGSLEQFSELHFANHNFLFTKKDPDHHLAQPSCDLPPDQ